MGTPASPQPGQTPAKNQDSTQKIKPADLAKARLAPPAPSQKPPATAPTTKTPLAWLACAPLPPIPLGLAPVVTIGRGAECDLVLPHASVSRVHAAIREIAGALHFEDRSTYGSYVNGARAMSCAIQPGVVITIGPYELSVHRTERGSSEAVDVDTRPIGAFLRDLPSTEAISGRLEKQPLAEVLQSLEFNRKSGTLQVFCGPVAGTLVLYEGGPMFATFGPLQNEEAVHAMVAQRSGYYTFQTKIEPGERAIEKPLTAILLEASRQQDESDDDD